MFLMGELEISGKGEPHGTPPKGKNGKRTIYKFPDCNEFELALSDGGKDDCHFRFYVGLDESEGVTVGSEDLESSIINGYFVLAIKDKRGDVIHLTLSPEQVNVIYRALEDAHVAFESMARLQKLIPAELKS